MKGMQMQPRKDELRRNKEKERPKTKKRDP